MSGTRRRAGLLGPEVEGYGAWLAHRGYTPLTVRNILKDLDLVGVWLSARGSDVDWEQGVLLIRESKFGNHGKPAIMPSSASNRLSRNGFGSGSSA